MIATSNFGLFTKPTSLPAVFWKAQLYRGPDKTKPLITVDKLTITSSYHGIVATIFTGSRPME